MKALAPPCSFSHRYIAGRQLPDKAVSVLDTACARLALGQSAMPAAIEDARRQLDDLEVQERVLQRESAIGADHTERLAAIAEAKEQTVEARLKDSAASASNKESELVTKIREIRTQIWSERRPAAAGRLRALRRRSTATQP